MKPFDANGEFNSAAPSGGDSLRQVAVRSAGTTLFSGGVGLAIQIVSTVVLARLLAPSDFGVVTMVTTFSVLLASVGQIGLPEAIVQAKKMDHRLASNLFWINVGTGALLTVVFAAAGSVLGKLYHDTRVVQVAMGSSLTIFVTSTSVLHLALLKRAMRFSEVSVNDIVARTVSVVVSVLFGWAGWGYWALVAGAIALPLSQSIGACLLCPWLPGLPRRRVEGTGHTLLFALNTYGRFGVNYATRNTDNLLVGLHFNAQSLGFYKKAYDLFALSATQFVHSLTLVFVSSLSRVRQDSDQYRRYLLGSLTVMAFFGMGLAADLTLVGKDLIRVLLGPGWSESGRIFTFFGPGIGAMMVYYTHGWIHLSIGRADRWFRWGFVEFAVTVMLFLVGLPWGPVGVAIAWTASYWILLIPGIWYAGKPIGFGVGPLLSAVWRYIIASLLAASLTSLILRNSPNVFGALGTIGIALRIVSVSLLLGALYLIGVVLLYRTVEPIYQMIKLLRDMSPWRTITGLSPITEAEDIRKSSENYRHDRDVPVRCGTKPLVSILIPAYNAEKWIAQTIRSAIAQRWEPKEVIVVDDGSTDRTLEVARQFESKSILVITQPNQGASAARNKALSASRGDYIQWLDADDLLAPDKISRQMAAVGQGIGELTLLSSPWGQFWHRHNRGSFVPSALWCDLSPPEYLIRKMGQNLFMQTSTWLVSRKLTETAGPWSTALSVDDDGEYFCRVLVASNGIHFVPDANVYYRYSGTSGLAYIGQSNKKLDSFWRSMQLHIQYLLSLEDSARAQAACLKYLETNLVYFYATRADIVEQMQQRAAAMGGRLSPPRLSWKFSWLKAIFGWNLATRAQLSMPHIKWSLVSLCDEILFHIENRNKVRDRVEETHLRTSSNRLETVPEEVSSR
ncbi:MAG TPA: oligosaccharide flippase family protein [Candidatus Dormibacteraeota bacterium]|nr:oligosaccharide flippase family protein [Candidatus Dormibacteraeota bacterium]